MIEFAPTGRSFPPHPTGALDRYDFELQAGGEWQKLSSLDVALLSTEVAGGFTGVTTGMLCENGEAAFDYFTYSEF